MPYLDIRIANATLDASARRALGQRGTALLHDILGKHTDLTAVSIIDLPASSWMIGGSTQAESGRPAAHAEATITTGTNTAEQKGRFIAEMAALLKEILPKLHEATYVLVREIDARGWGYDGSTQEARKQSGTGARAGTVAEAEFSGVEPDIKRSASGAIDTEFYMAQARRMRSETVRGTMEQLLAAIVRLPGALKIAHPRANPCRHG
jgi:4-oxalocrotonate tautomerase